MPRPGRSSTWNSSLRSTSGPALPRWAANDRRSADSARGLLSAVLLDPVATDRLLNSSGVDPEVLVSTDDNLRLEFSTPRGNVLDGPQSLMDNLQFINQRSAK